MKRLAVPSLTAILGSGALIAVVVTVPAQGVRATAAYLVAMGALGLMLALADLSQDAHRRRSAFESALAARQPGSERVRPLDQMEHDVAQGLRNPDDLNRRLRPILREVAACRLLAGHGIALDGTTDAARTLLGDEAWQLVGPNRAELSEEQGDGLDEEGLDRVLGVLERL